MTREEAINIISQMIKDEEGFLSDNTVEAHKMAIKALEQQPCDDKRNIEEIAEVMKCDADADTKCRMISNILNTKPHYFKLQQPCEDAISRQDVLDLMQMRLNGKELYKAVYDLPSVSVAEKVGEWKLSQRGKFIDINCSECGFTRVKEFAYGYTIDEIDMEEFKEFVVRNKMNYCECCGARMQEAGK